MKKLLLLMILMQAVFIAYSQDTAPVIFVNIEPSGYDFGEIPLGDNPQLVIPVKNTGDTALTIRNISCDANSVKLKASKTVIKAGKTGYIYATYAPADFVTGSFKNKVTVSFAGINSASSFVINGAVVPAQTNMPAENPKHRASNNSPKAVGRRGYDATH